MVGLTDLLRKYGSICVKLQKFPGTQRVGAMLRIKVCLCGVFSGATMAAYLAAAYEVRPNAVSVRLLKPSPSSLRRALRPAVYIEWEGYAAQSVLEAVGYAVGKPTFDTKARAYKRWRVYRRASGSFWGDHGRPG